MWLQLMWLQFEVVRGPVGVVWGRFGAGLGPCGPRSSSKTTPNDPDRTGPRTTSNCSHMICSHIHRSPTGAAAGTISRLLLKPVGVKESFTFCYAIVLSGRKSEFRAGFRSDSNRESFRMGLLADFEAFPIRIQPNSGPEYWFPSRKQYCIT